MNLVSPQFRERAEALRVAFRNGFDLTEQVIAASGLWKECEMTFWEIDAFLCLYEGWCGRYMWMSRLSENLKANLRAGKVSKTVAEILSFLSVKDQDRMMGLINDSRGLNPKRANGIRDFIILHVRDYDDIVRRQIATSKVVVMRHRSEALETMTPNLVSLPATSITIDDVPWQIRTISDLLKFLEGMPLESIGLETMSPAQIAELRKIAEDSSVTASRVANKLREAWVKRLAKVAPEGAIASD